VSQNEKEDHPEYRTLPTPSKKKNELQKIKTSLKKRLYKAKKRGVTGEAWGLAPEGKDLHP